MYAPESQQAEIFRHIATNVVESLRQAGTTKVSAPV
jgi:hypothetical protein